MTSASGTFTSCGFGQPFSLQFSCTGTDCSYLNDFPGATCITDGATLSCTNGVVCPGSNYTTKFTVDQPISAVTQSMQIFLSDECTEFDVTNNGTQSGVIVQSLPIDDCTLKASSTSSSSSLPSGTSSTTVAATTSSTSSSTSTSSTSKLSSTSPSSKSTSTSSTSILSSNASSSTSVGTSSSTRSSTSRSPSSMPTGSSSSINSLSPGSGTSSGVLSNSTTKATSATSVTMKTMVIVTSGITVTVTEPCSQGSEATPAASVSLSSPCPTCVNSNSTMAGSGVPQALFGSNPTGSSNASRTGTPVLGSAATGTTSGNVRSTISPAVTTPTGAAQIVSTSSARSCKKRPHLNIYFLVLVLFGFLHLATALDISPAKELAHRAISPPVLPRDTSPNPSSSDLVLRGEGSLGKQFTEILEDWVAGKITTPSLSETIVAEIYNAVCSHYASAAITAGAFAEVGALLEYLSLVFDTIALPTGPEGWLIAFAFTVMVNVVVNELFPMISQMADQYCEAAKDLVLCSTHFEDDAMNCGFCGNQCPSGSCKNSACVSDTCTGETCETFTTCGPGGTCVCASTAEGTGFCVDGSTPCASLQTCGSSSDCPAGVVCAVASCCGINVCVGATSCGGANATSAAKLLFRKDVDALTFGHLY